jgi:hypothetical protein
MDESLIYRCECIIRDLANDLAWEITGKPFLNTVIKRLKFENESDWTALCSVMDVLQDTELAKENFLKYGLSGPTKIIDEGEEYLRLYGIVNAIYLQKSAIISFIELTKLKNKRQIVSKIEGLRILELRHIIGAHTVNFIEDGKINPHQFNHNFDGEISTQDSRGIFKKFDLEKLLFEFNTVAEDIMIKATEKFITTVLKNGGQKLKEYTKRLNAVKSEKKGTKVTSIIVNGKPVMHIEFMKSDIKAK